MFRCGKCGGPIAADATACPSCGFVFGPSTVSAQSSAASPPVSGVFLWLALCLAAVLLVVSVFLFIGGLGPLMWFGHFGEHFFDEKHWTWNLWIAFAYAFVVVWLGGVVYCVVQFRGVFAAIGSALERPAQRGDYLVYSGHLALIASIVNAIWFTFGARDFVYGYLLLAALLYSSGLAVLAFNFRSRASRQEIGG